MPIGQCLTRAIVVEGHLAKAHKALACGAKVVSSNAITLQDIIAVFETRSQAWNIRLFEAKPIVHQHLLPQFLRSLLSYIPFIIQSV